MCNIRTWYYPSYSYRPIYVGIYLYFLKHAGNIVLLTWFMKIINQIKSFFDEHEAAKILC